MGDRTHVELTVLTEHKERVLAFCKHGLAEDPCEDSDGPEGFSYLSFEEVNYGELTFLSKLEETGIAYDSQWGRGDEYGCGVCWCRFDEKGIPHGGEAYDSELNPNIDDLEKIIAKGSDLPLERYQALVDYITAHRLKHTVPGWENQVHHGKIAQTRNLLAA